MIYNLHKIGHMFDLNFIFLSLFNLHFFMSNIRSIRLHQLKKTRNVLLKKHLD